MTSQVRPMNAAGTMRIVPMNEVDWASIAGSVIGAGSSYLSGQQQNQAAQIQANIAAANAQLQASVAASQAAQAEALARAEAARAEAAKYQVVGVAPVHVPPAPRSAVADWWSNRSTVEKGAIIVGGAAIVVGGIYLLTRKRKRRK